MATFRNREPRIIEYGRSDLVPDVKPEVGRLRIDRQQVKQMSERGWRGDKKGNCCYNRDHGQYCPFEWQPPEDPAVGEKSQSHDRALLGRRREADHGTKRTEGDLEHPPAHVD